MRVNTPNLSSKPDKMCESYKRYCIMPSCKGEKFDLVHKFPRNDDRAREWLEIINLPEISKLPMATIRKSKFICTRHFAPEAYKHAESRSLNITAVPSQNLERLESLEHIVHRERKVQKQVYDESELATKFCEVDALEQQKELEQEEEIIMVSPEKSVNVSPIISQLSYMSSQLSPIKRRKVTHEVSWEQPCDSPSRVAVDLSDVMMPLTTPLEEMLEPVGMLEDPHETSIESVTYEPKLDFLEIRDEDKYPGGIRLNYIWLRDHCKCDKCYDKETSQRKLNLKDINLDIKPLDYSIEEGGLLVKWQDDHDSIYELDFLYNSQYAIQRPKYQERYEELWDKESIQTCDYANVDLSDLLCHESAVKTVLTSIIKYGVAFINKVPTTQHSTEMTITRLFPLMKSFFGEMWIFSDTKDRHDFAYSKKYMAAHTDNTYFNDAAGLKILHCIQHNGDGGENFLVDGFNVVSTLKSEHPEAYQRLTEYQIPSEYVEEGRHHCHLGPIIKVNSLTGLAEQLRFNMNDRAILDTIPFDKIQEFYSDIQLLSKQMQKKSNEWKFKLNPGTVMIFDNYRVLHGRTKYTGKRIMTGAYVLRTEFLSAARVAGVIS